MPNIEQGMSKIRRLQTSTFEIPCSEFDIQKEAPPSGPMPCSPFNTHMRRVCRMGHSAASAHHLANESMGCRCALVHPTLLPSVATQAQKTRMADRCRPSWWDIISELSDYRT